jgi:hypothetical protein
MTKNLKYRKVPCTSRADSGMIWLHSKRDSKLVKNGSNEYKQLIEDGYCTDRAIALGIKKEEDNDDIERDHEFDILSIKEHRKMAKEYGIKGYGNASKNALIDLIIEKQGERSEKE